MSNNLAIYPGRCNHGRLVTVNDELTEGTCPAGRPVVVANDPNRSLGRRLYWRHADEGARRTAR